MAATTISIATEAEMPLIDASIGSSGSISPESTPDAAPASHSVSSISSGEDAIDLKTVNEKILAQQKNEEKEITEKPIEANMVKMVDTYGNEFELPDISFKAVRKAIPSHCFKRSATKSLLYTARDIIQWLALFMVFKIFVTPDYIPSPIVRGGLWAAYTVVAGWIGTGLWVIAHECGHGAFSESKRLNDTVGFILHSALGVPYFSWQISHRKHHQNTGNLARDMVFVPAKREEYASKLGLALHELSELAEETPIFTLLTLIGQQLMGWNFYLCANMTGHNKHESAPNGRGKGKKNGPLGGVNHFQPSSPIFDDKDMPLIYLSDIGLIITAAILTYVGKTYGAWNLFVWYGAPYLWVNNWLGKSFWWKYPTFPLADRS